MFGQRRDPFGGDFIPPYIPPAQIAPPIAMPPVAPMAAAVQPKKTPVWKDILGAILDAVGTAAGGHPTYFPMKLKLKEKLDDEAREDKKLNRPVLRDVGDDLVEYDPLTHATAVRYHGQPKALEPTAFQRDYEFVRAHDPATAEQMIRNRGLKTATIYNPETGNYELRLIGGQDTPPPRLKAPPPDAIPLGGAGSGPRGFR